MNKLLTKVASVTLGLALALGIGVAVAKSNKAVSVHASSNATLAHTDFSTSWITTRGAQTGTSQGFTLSSTDGMYDSGHLRHYAGGTLTLSSSVGNMTNVVFTCTANGTNNYGPGKMSGEGYVASSGKTGTWTGNAASFSLTGGQSRITSIEITYTPAATYTITYDANGGSGTMENTVAVNPVVAACSFTAPSEDKAFDYWHTTSSGTGGTTYAVGATPGKSVDLFAIWKDKPTLSSIAITTPPTKTIYTEGENFDPTGMVVTATYSDSSTESVLNSCTFSPSENLSTSDTLITVSYTYGAVTKTATQAITVNAAPKLANIEITGTNTSPITTVTGYVPSGMTASWTTTYGGTNLGQVTNGNSQTLNVSKFSETKKINVTSMQLWMHSNASAGKGNLSYSINGGDSTFLVGESSSSAVEFNTWGNNTEYGSSFRWVDISLENPIEVPANQSFALKIACVTTNSLYCTAFKLGWDEAPAWVTADRSTVTLAADGSSADSVVLSAHNLDGVVEFTATSQNTEVLPQANLSISGSTLTITAGTAVSAGVVVKVHAGNGSVTTEDIDITVVLTVVRNITGLSITTYPTQSVKQGSTLNVDGIVLSATFDAGESPVAYSEAAGNLGDIVFKVDGVLAVPGTTVLSALGNHTVTCELEVGNNTEEASYVLKVNAPTYLYKVTSEAQLWDGQQILIADKDATKGASAWVEGNNVPAVSLAFDSENHRIDVDDASEATIYTLGRVKADADEDGNEEVVYTIYGGGYYLYAAGLATTKQNWLKGKTTLDNSCYWNISINDGVLSVVSVNNTYVPYMQFNNAFACYAAASYTAVDFYVANTDTTGAAAAASFKQNALHFGDYNPDGNPGWCKDVEHGYYAHAKQVWNAMSETDKAAVDELALARLSAWATANGDVLVENGSGSYIIKSGSSRLPTGGLKEATMGIIIAISVITTIGIGAVIVLHKKKRIR